MFCFSFSCPDLLHGNCLLTRFNFSIKILLAKITFLFQIFLFYLLNMSLFCIGSISWCCSVVPLFCCSSHVSLFRGIPIVLPVFCECSCVLPAFCGCLCSSVPGFIVCQISWHHEIPKHETRNMNNLVSKQSPVMGFLACFVVL